MGGSTSQAGPTAFTDDNHQEDSEQNTNVRGPGEKNQIVVNEQSDLSTNTKITTLEDERQISAVGAGGAATGRARGGANAGHGASVVSNTAAGTIKGEQGPASVNFDAPVININGHLVIHNGHEMEQKQITEGATVDGVDGVVDTSSTAAWHGGASAVSAKMGAGGNVSASEGSSSKFSGDGPSVRDSSRSAMTVRGGTRNGTGASAGNYGGSDQRAKGGDSAVDVSPSFS